MIYTRILQIINLTNISLLFSSNPILSISYHILKGVNMKTTFLVFLILSCSILAAFDIINENFASALPAGWTVQSTTANIHWQWSNTPIAGGTPGELMFQWSPSETVDCRYISPAFNTTKVHDMTLSFKHMVDWYSGSFTLKVQISHDLTNWTDIWTTTPTGNVAAGTVTANIGYALGQSPTTYIAFLFSGFTTNIDWWYIDDVKLSYTNTLGSGTWDVGTHYPVGNVLIPDGHTLTLQAGTTVYMGNNSIMDVDGRLLANGTENSVIFIGCQPMVVWKGMELINVNAVNDSTIIQYTNIANSIETGIQISQSSKVRISHCNIMHNSISGSYIGGGLSCNYSNIIVEYCNFYDNSADLRGAAAEFWNCTPFVRHNLFFENSVSTYGILSLFSSNISNVQYNHITNNYFPNAGQGAVYIFGCNGSFSRNVISNNDAMGLYLQANSSSLIISNCDIVNNASYGIFIVGNANLQMDNNIVYGNIDFQIYNSSGTSAIPIRFSCIQNGYYSCYNIAASSYSYCIEMDPLFVYPTAGTGSAYYTNFDGYRLQDLSPCIDAGDPIFYDADFSNSDIGVFTRRLKPTLYRAADVSPDQGHQVDLRWYRNDKDYSWDPSAWYHVFRWMPDRNELPSGATVVTDPRQITPELISQNREIYWYDGTRTMYFLGQQKAMNRPDYGLIVPTLQDSSSTGTHDEVFVVTYFDNVYFWDSVGLSGYSVDNIPPLAPTRTAIARTGSDQYTLTWDEVTEGIWEGNTYEETNPLTYKIYGNADYDFELTPANLIATTTNPWIILNNQPPNHLYYRIVVSDSE